MDRQYAFREFRQAFGESPMTIGEMSRSTNLDGCSHTRAFHHDGRDYLVGEMFGNDPRPYVVRSAD